MTERKDHGPGLGYRCQYCGSFFQGNLEGLESHEKMHERGGLGFRYMENEKPSGQLTLDEVSAL